MPLGEEFQLTRLVDDYEINMDTAQKLADDTVVERHFSLLDTLCGHLSVQTLWKMLYLCQYQRTVQEELTMLSLVTENVAYSDQLPDSPWKYYRILAQLAAVWESRIQVAKNELTDSSFTGVVAMLERCSRQLDCAGIPPSFHKVLHLVDLLQKTDCEKTQLRHVRLKSNCENFKPDNLKLSKESQPENDNINIYLRTKDVHTGQGQVQPAHKVLQLQHEPWSKYPAFPPTAVVAKHTLRKLLISETETYTNSKLLKKSIKLNTGTVNVKDGCSTKKPLNPSCLAKTTIMPERSILAERSNSFLEDNPRKIKPCMKTLDYYFQKQDLEKKNIV